MIIHKETPDIREELYEMSNRVCDLCGHPIQDVILAVIEHSTPVALYARGPLSVEEASRRANQLSNLRIAHYSCNTVKKDRTRKEWFTLGLNNRELRNFEVWELDMFRNRIAAPGRKGGKIAGPISGAKHAMNRTGVCGRSRDQMVVDGLKGARVSREFKLGIAAWTPEQMIEHGRKYGRIAAESGQLARARLCINSDTVKESGRRNGKINGRLAVETGQLASLRTFEHQSQAGKARGHARWHIARNIFKLDTCELCKRQHKLNGKTLRFPVAA